MAKGMDKRPHSSECVERMMKALEETEAGSRRIEAGQRRRGEAKNESVKEEEGERPRRRAPQRSGRNG